MLVRQIERINYILCIIHIKNEISCHFMHQISSVLFSIYCPLFFFLSRAFVSSIVCSSAEYTTPKTMFDTHARQKASRISGQERGRWRAADGAEQRKPMVPPSHTEWMACRKRKRKLYIIASAKRREEKANPFSVALEKIRRSVGISFD